MTLRQLDAAMETVEEGLRGTGLPPHRQAAVGRLLTFVVNCSREQREATANELDEVAFIQASPPSADD